MIESAVGEPVEDNLQAMCLFLDLARPKSTACALRHLRAAFPEVALADRVRAFEGWRSDRSLAA